MSVVPNPSGALFNPSNNLFLINGTNSAQFIFSTEHGTILGFNFATDPHNAIVVADRSSFGAVYKGLATASSCCCRPPLLFAPDFHNGRVDIFTSAWQYQGFFKDNSIPAGFAPFNVVNLGGKLYVSYAKQLPPANHDDDPGVGNGFIDIFNASGLLIKRLVSNGNLNSPWGMALAPATFGQFAGALLVGNFGDGFINAYDPNTGAFLGTLLDASNNPLFIDGLWSLVFDSHGILYFSSGPDQETKGLVGTITIAP